MYSGTYPGLDFSNLDKIRETYERTTGMTVHERHPTAETSCSRPFPGPIRMRSKRDGPARERRRFRRDPLASPPTFRSTRVISTNLRSDHPNQQPERKRRSRLVLSREFGLELPKPMHPEVGNLVNEKADSESRELAAEEIYETFKAEFLQKNSPSQTRGLSNAQDQSRKVKSLAWQRLN